MSTLNAAGGQSTTQTRRARGASPAAPAQRQAAEPARGRTELRAQVPAVLRQRQSSTPGGSAGRQTIASLANRAGQGRGTTVSDPAAIINNELRTAGLSDDFQRLSPRGRQQYLAIARELVPQGVAANAGGNGRESGGCGQSGNSQAPGLDHARRQLMTLLENGRLNDTDSQGRTLLSNLDHIRTDRLRDVDNRAALQSTLTQIGWSGSVAASSPAEYSRVSHELWQNGRTRLPNGDTIRVPEVTSQNPGGQITGGVGMFGMAAPGLSAVNRALGQYTQAQAANSEHQAEYRERTVATLNDNQRRTYEGLNPAQRNQFLDLATNQADRQNAELARAFQTAAPRPNVDSSVTNLLTQGKLVSTDSQGRTLLDNLSSLRQDNPLVFSQTTRLLAGESGRGQQRGWTLPTEQNLRTEQPAEYARLLHGLTTGDRAVRAADGTVLRGPAAPGPGAFPAFVAAERLLPDALVNRAMESGSPLSMTNSNGETISARFQRLQSNAQGAQRYRVSVGEQSFEVNSQAGEDTRGALMNLANFQSMVPAHLRGELHQVNLNSGDFPGNAAAGERLGMPNFRAAATAGNHTIDFWNGASNVVESVFNHESGHLIGDRRGFADGVWDRYNFQDDHAVPVRWQQRVNRDGNEISDYGSRAIQEDFADSWEAYVSARTRGQAAMSALRNEHPNRFELLDRIYNNGATW